MSLRHPCLNLKQPQIICLMSLRPPQKIHQMSLRHPCSNLKQPQIICLMSLRDPCLSLRPPQKIHQMSQTPLFESQTTSKIGLMSLRPPQKIHQMSQTPLFESQTTYNNMFRKSHTLLNSFPYTPTILSFT